MPRNSSGAYTLAAGNPVVPDTLIETAWANPTMADIAQALTDSLDRYGRGTMLAPVKFVDGAVNAPGISFSGESSTGLYRVGLNDMGIAVGGTNVADFFKDHITLLKPQSRGDPVDDADLVNKAWATTTFLNSTGNDAITGDLTVLGKLGVIDNTPAEPTVQTLEQRGITIRKDGIGDGYGGVLTLSNKGGAGSATVRKFGGILFDAWRDVMSPSYVAAIWAEGNTPAGNYGNLVFGTIYTGSSAWPTPRMRIDNGGAVTINSAGPSAWGIAGRGTLELNGTAAAGALLGFKINDAQAGYVYYNGTAGEIALVNANPGPCTMAVQGRTLSIYPSGNVGIGTPSDTANTRLAIGTQSDALNFVQTTCAGNGRAGLGANAWGSAAIEMVTNFSGATDGYGIPSGMVGIGAVPNTSMVFATNAAEQMRLNANGLGIGVPGPAYKLHVNAGGGSTTDAAVFLPVANFYGAGDQANFGLTIYSHPTSGNTDQGACIGTAASLIFRTGYNFIVQNSTGTDQMRIRMGSVTQIGPRGTDFTGCTVQIGTIASSGGNYASGINITDWGGTTSSVLLHNNVIWNFAPNNANAVINFQDSVTYRWRVNLNGGVQNYAGNNVNISDKSMKTHIRKAKEYLDKLRRVPVRTFRYDDQTDDHEHIGMVAQELQEQLPELVTSWTVEKREDSPPTTRTGKFLGIYQTDLQFVQLRALQELADRVEALEKKQ